MQERAVYIGKSDDFIYALRFNNIGFYQLSRLVLVPDSCCLHLKTTNLL